MQSISNDHIDTFLLLLKQCFTSNQAATSKEIDTLQVKLTNCYPQFINQLKFNLLKATAVSPKVQLEEVFDDLEQYAAFMVRDSYALDSLFTAKGWEPAGIVYDNPVWSDVRLAEAKDDHSNGRSLSRIQAGLDSGYPVEELYADLTPVEIQMVQKGLASSFVKKAWERTSKLYALHGGIVREVPRKEGKLVVVNTPILQDLRRYVPDMQELTAFMCPTEAHALEEWARHLNTVRWWNYPLPRPWPAPIEYEQAFHDAPDRSEFLSGLRRLLNVLEPYLNIPDQDNPLFREDNQPLSEHLREEMRCNGLRRLRVNAKLMGQWLQSRQKPAGEQLLEALERILLVPDCSDKWEPTNELTVACQHAESDVTLHFNLLLRRFQEEVPQSSTALNALQTRLTNFLSVPLVKLTGVGFDDEESKYGLDRLYAALIERFPQLTFVNGVKTVTDERVNKFADSFWLNLKETVICRLPWARKALDIVAGALAHTKSPNGTPSDLEIVLDQRQVALICFYKNIKITRSINAKDIANDNGFTSKTSAQKLYQHYTEIMLFNDRTGFDFDDKIRAKNMMHDIEAIKPFLNDAEIKRADNELLIIANKIV